MQVNISVFALNSWDLFSIQLYKPNEDEFCELLNGIEFSYKVPYNFKKSIKNVSIN